jgi:hypothetical protein
MRFIPSIRSLLFALVVLAMSAASFAQIGISVSIAPPALPVYEQPPLPAQGYIWTPGYWAYSEGDYYWVPGTWVMAPQIGFLWTPGYWGWGNGMYVFNEGYWGPHVGFYGGINYGYGYTGEGYQGGRWDNGQFAYNRAVNNVNVTNIHNTYTQTIVNNTTVNRVSFNGGTDGVRARPTAAEQVAASAPHQPATAIQVQHRQAAMANHALLASVNHGRPPIAATSKPAEFNGPGVAKASAAGSIEKTSRAVVATPAGKRAPVHAADLPAVVHQAVRNTGNVERDKINQQEQDQLRDSQEKQRQDLQQKQASDHERAAQESPASANVKQLEKQHQAQTQALAQRHTTEQSTLRETQAKRPEGKAETPHT